MEKEFFIDELYETFLKLETKQDCQMFFADLLTYKEIENMAQRVRAAKLLKEGKTYVQIIEETGISNATLSRVSKALHYGKGYKKFLE